MKDKGELEALNYSNQFCFMRETPAVKLSPFLTHEHILLLYCTGSQILIIIIQQNIQLISQGKYRHRNFTQFNEFFIIGSVMAEFFYIIGYFVAN